MGGQAQGDSDRATYIQGKPLLGLKACASAAATNVLSTPHVDERRSLWNVISWWLPRRGEGFSDVRLVPRTFVACFG